MSGRRGRKAEAITLQSHVEEETESNVDHFIIDTSAEEVYYCEDCGNDYDTIEAYNDAHIGPESCTGTAEARSDITVHAVEPMEENDLEDDIVDVDSLVIEEDLVEELDDSSEPQLWEVLEDDDEPLPENVTETEIEILDTDAETNKSERYFCFDCHSIFETRQSAEEHSCPQAETNSEKGSKQNKAKFCKTQTPLRRKLAAATATSSNSNSTICHICKTTFSSPKCLKFHMRIHNKRTMKSIQDALPVGAHQQYSELDQFYCEICNKSFEQNLLTVHKQMHQSLKLYLCGTCNRSFENVANYEMHLKIHERQGLINSNNCTKSSNTSSTTTSTTTTKKLANGKEKPGFACQYCDRVFLRPYEKVKHERVHTGEKPYSCEVCGKTFRVSYSLTLHLRTHTNIRPYVCTTCNKRFKSHQVYSHHLRIHSSERQYTCDSCPKSFRTSVQLYAHKNTHTKPYQCAVCNRPFASLYAVKAHMATHRTNDAKSVTSETIRTQQLTNKYWCVTCGAEYARPFALRLHMKAAHGHPTDADTRLAKVAAPDDEFEITAPDTETAVLIAAAKADSAYLNAAANDVDITAMVPKYEECIEVSTDAFDVENFHSEEIITDWLK